MRQITIISGGQTGIDQMGLQVAKELGLPTGGTAPKGYWTENGPDLSLRDDYGLAESSGGYKLRTQQNVFNSDMTVLFGNVYSPGSQLTLEYLDQHHKPHLINPNTTELVHFLIHHDVHTLNVAGNRGSKLTKAKTDEYADILREALKSTI